VTSERFRSRVALAAAVGRRSILRIDPVDLGAKAQRMVRAHLEHFSVEAADTPDSSLE
jgi:hypothetical protein